MQMMHLCVHTGKAMACRTWRDPARRADVESHVRLPRARGTLLNRGSIEGRWDAHTFCKAARADFGGVPTSAVSGIVIMVTP